jgi:hypothetical protein
VLLMRKHCRPGFLEVRWFPQDSTSSRSTINHGMHHFQAYTCNISAVKLFHFHVVAFQTARDAANERAALGLEYMAVVSSERPREYAQPGFSCHLGELGNML